MVDLLTVSIILFAALLVVAVYRDRKNIEFSYVLAMRRTKKGVRWLDAVAKSHPLFWSRVGALSVVFGLAGMAYGVLLVSGVALGIAAGFVKGPALAFVLPTTSATAGLGAGGLVFFVPFWYWLAVIASIMVPHEMLHGVVARSLGMKVKSVGALLFLVIPGAFVELDEKALKRMKTWPKLKILAAGSFANFAVFAGLALLVQFVLAPGLIQAIGVPLVNVTQGSPAWNAGLRQGDVIAGVGGVAFGQGQDNPLAVALSGKRPGDAVSIATLNRTVLLVLGSAPDNASRPYMGIVSRGTTITKTNFFDAATVQGAFYLLSMISMFSFVVAAMNLLPWKPFDGGLIAETILAHFAGRKRGAFAANVLTALVFAVVAFDFLGPGLLGLLR